MNKIAIIGTVGVPANYGGFETLVENLLNKTSKDIEYTVYCSSRAYSTKQKTYKNAKLYYLPLKANGIQSILYDILSIFIALRKHDCLLILGVSGCLILPVVKIFSKKKIIVNIDGLEHRRDKWKPFIRKFLKWSEKIAVTHADTIVADNKAIQDYVQAEYGKSSELIAYGGDHVNVPFDQKTEDYYFALCRIEPENNIHVILSAFENTNCKLKFVGNWKNSEYGTSLRAKYTNAQNIELLDPIYDLVQLGKLRSSCKCYIHGHSAGGTNPSLVEAMFFSKPIIAYDVTYNRETTENKAIYFKDAVHLRSIISSANAESVIVNATSMIEIAHRRYKWDVITEQYERLY